MSSDVVRISCSGFVRIRDEVGRVALYYTPKERRQILRPIGGSLRAPRRTLNLLERRYAAANFEGNDLDLRFVIPTSKVNDVAQWFKARSGRETDVTRLAKAHLSQLGVFDERDFAHIDLPFAYRTTVSGITNRRGVFIARTQYLIEVFNAHMPPDLFDRVWAKTIGREPILKFVTQQEVDENHGPGGYVSSLAPALFRKPRR